MFSGQLVLRIPFICLYHVPWAFYYYYIIITPPIRFDHARCAYTVLARYHIEPHACAMLRRQCSQDELLPKSPEHLDHFSRLTLQNLYAQKSTAFINVAGLSISGRLILQPTVFYSCPNEAVTFTCHDSQINTMTWRAEPYITEKNAIRYSATRKGLPLYIMNHSSQFFSSLIYVTRHSQSMDLTTSLTVNTSGLENHTTITCRTVANTTYSSSASAILSVAGLYDKVCRKIALYIDTTLLHLSVQCLSI